MTMIRLSWLSTRGSTEPSRVIWTLPFSTSRINVNGTCSISIVYHLDPKRISNPSTFVTGNISHTQRLLGHCYLCQSFEEQSKGRNLLLSLKFHNFLQYILNICMPHSLSPISSRIPKYISPSNFLSYIFKYLINSSECCSHWRGCPRWGLGNQPMATP